ncbi:MAG: PadR family transcriptional regulator [Nitrososphaerota archaeon]|nr:PadR family transcriptional regulator [Candidatus Geocrenenecus dongiae]
MVSSAYNRLVRKLTVENLWIYILTLLKESPLYGYELRSKIFERFGFKPGMITCYVVLYKLEKEKLISSEERSDVKSGGAPRKYYKITQKGLMEVKRAKDFLSKLVDRL